MIPYGYCQCGCGNLTPLYNRTDKRTGAIKGQHRRFYKGGHGNIATNAEERFWPKVDKTCSCWEWTASKDSFGYGTFGVTRRDIQRAHRVSWVFAHGEIPDGLCVLHKCDNPKCVRPDHLFLGTKLDNAIDRMEKGRNRDQSGDKSSAAKLDWEKVELIRADNRTYPEIVKEYGIQKSTVSSIKLNKSWRRTAKVYEVAK